MTKSERLYKDLQYANAKAKHISKDFRLLSRQNEALKEENKQLHEYIRKINDNE